MLKILLFIAVALLSVYARALNNPLKVVPLAAPPVAASSINSVKSYREWKAEKVQTVLTQVLLTRNQILKAKSEGHLPIAESLGKQLSQQQWNLEVANDLSVTDYFVLYLSQQPESDRFQQAAHKLTINEVAELMQAYAAALGSGGGADSLTQNTGATTMGRKIPSQAVQNGDQIK